MTFIKFFLNALADHLDGKEADGITARYHLETKRTLMVMDM